MRLVFAIDGLKKGGAQRVFSNLTDYMANQNDEVYLILLNKTNVEYYINQNVKIIYVDEREIKKNKIIKFFKLIQYKKILAKILLLNCLEVLEATRIDKKLIKIVIIIMAKEMPNILSPEIMI